MVPEVSVESLASVNTILKLWLEDVAVTLTLVESDALVAVAALPLQLDDVAALPVQEAEEPEMLLEIVAGRRASETVPDERLEAFSEDREEPLPEKLVALRVFVEALNVRSPSVPAEVIVPLVSDVVTNL